MENVALFLQSKANGCSPESRDFDLFGRSAFNRYYYAIFLQVRSMLCGLDKAWERTAHADIPMLLNGQVLDTIRQKRTRAIKLGDRDAIQKCNRGMTSTKALAALMKQAYGVRVTADYYPEIPVKLDSRGRFGLNSVPVTTAHEWSGQVRGFEYDIKRAWRIND